ncbi:MAG: ABC transporter permease [Candidatus Hadarchaeum sp.]
MKSIPYLSWITPIIAIIVGFFIGAVVIALSGLNPIEAYAKTFSQFFGSLFKIGEIVVFAIPLMIIGAGLVLSFEANFWNIGAEGQLWVGGLLATLIGLYINTSAPIYFITMVIAAFLGGVAWGLLPVILKIKYGTNEILTSMLLCPIAILLIDALLTGPLKDPVYLFNQTQLIAVEAWLPVLVPETRITVALFLALACVAFVHIILQRCSLGYQIRAVGHGIKAAKASGINVSRTLLLTMVISSGLSGVAGYTLLTSIHHRLLRGFSPGGGFLGFWGYGYMAIAVALLAKGKPLATIGTAAIFGFLEASSYLMEAAAGVSRYIMIFVEAVILIAIVWLYRIR